MSIDNIEKSMHIHKKFQKMATKNAAVTKIYKFSENNSTMWTTWFDCKQLIEKNPPYGSGFWFDNIESKGAKKNVVNSQHFSGRHQIEAFLKLVYCKITPKNIESVVVSLVQYKYDVVDILQYDVITNITACTRNN